MGAERSWFYARDGVVTDDVIPTAEEARRPIAPAIFYEFNPRSPIYGDRQTFPELDQVRRGEEVLFEAPKPGERTYGTRDINIAK